MPKNSRGVEVAEILPDQCIGCQICVAECPVGAIELNDEGVAEIDPEVCVGCGKCHDVCPVGAVSFQKEKATDKSVKEKKEKAAESVSGYEGMAVFIELDGDSGSDVAWELVGKARELAELRQTRVIGFLLGSDCKQVAQEAVAWGCDEVHLMEHSGLYQYFSASYGEALTQLVDRVRPEVLLMGATHQGRDLAGIVATRLNTGLTADCTELDIDEDSGLLLMTRPTFGGNIMATIYCEKHRPQMSTVRPKVMQAGDRDPEREGTIREHEWELTQEGLPQLVESVSEVSAEEVDISQYPVLVVAGKGACDEQALPLLQELAEVLGGAVACSRPVAESGILPYERQVGQTGKTVAPKLYIGVGVSGAIQHRVAIQGSEKIMAINTDPESAILQIADVGIIGDYTRIIPEMIQQVKERAES
ncbi:MAG: FAD-binding protein [Desulfohalobiaceae bacterium]